MLRTAARRIAAALAVVALSVTGLTLASATPAAASGALVPFGFAPTSTSWPSPDEGWVFGYAPCGIRQCPVLLHSVDGGTSWRMEAAPDLQPSMFNLRSRVMFAAGGHGIATDGHVLYATHDGAATWSRVMFPGEQPRVIDEFGVNDLSFFAILVLGQRPSATTALYRSPLTENDWTTVPGGVSIAGQGGWDVAGHGVDAHVSLGRIFQSSRYWTQTGTSFFAERPAPCAAFSTTELDTTPDGHVVALCSSFPGMGKMMKEVKLSASGDSYTMLGEAPFNGITRDMGAASDKSVFIAAIGDPPGPRSNAAMILATFDGGETWSLPFATRGAAMGDLEFQDAQTGVFVYGGPRQHAALVFRTTDGGHTWNPIDFRP